MRSGRDLQALIWTPYDWICVIGGDSVDSGSGRRGVLTTRCGLWLDNKSINQEHSHGSIAVSRAAVQPVPGEGVVGSRRVVRCDGAGLRGVAIAESILSKPLEGGAEACERRISATLSRAGCGALRVALEAGDAEAKQLLRGGEVYHRGERHRTTMLSSLP